MPSQASVRSSPSANLGSPDSPLEDDVLLGAGRDTSARQRHKVSWVDLSWLMLTDVVGTSVLAFAGVAATLGWGLSVVLIVVSCPVAIYTAVLMSRSYQILLNEGLEASSMGEAARHTLCGKKGATFVYVAVYGFALLGNASYLLVLGKALQGVFYDSRLCLPTATFVSCVALVPFVTCVRRLRESVLLCFVNLFLILGVLAICEYQLASEGRNPEAQSFVVARDLSFLSSCGALTNIVYAYAGHWLYFELIAAMRSPSDFPKVFRINAPLQVALYLTVACSGYYFQGESAKGYFLNNLPKGSLYRVASTLLFVHVLIVYLLKSVVLARFFHSCIVPVRLDDPSFVAHMQYAGFAVMQLVFAFIVANSIPFFDALLGLIGGMLSAPISFAFPVLFYLGARARFGGGRNDFAPLNSPGSSEEGDMDAGDTEQWRLWFRNVFDTLRDGWQHVSAYERFSFAVLFVLVGITMLAGTIDNIATIIGNVGTYGLPFECHSIDNFRRR